MAVEQVAGCAWNARPDKRGLGGRMAWNPQKNPVSHVGKLYNALAWEIARAIVAEVEGVDEATVQLLSRIGQPVDQPALVAIELGCRGRLNERMRQEIRSLVDVHLSGIERISERLIRGEIPAF
ncbi:hypothetical protein KRX52_13195 [Pseudomonas sp. MAP12]|uniref:Methionine adenosyltransferase n=2 Tax=Geopseudomonas aromaticivorans TaxID=2849492 RepID=A0ABS6MY87_9GAMM|nr:hypothetical protein [Pseudomonas aromaticivorans]